MYYSGKSPIVYISGKVTGLPYELCVRKFSEAEALLKAEGYRVINPMRLCEKEMDWVSAMRVCIGALTLADCVCVLSDWRESKGARIEIKVAGFLGIPVQALAEF